MPLSEARLTLGPALFNWPADEWRDFYFRIADEAPVDCVHVGEVVCSKREPLFASVMDAVLARLEASGKGVVRSTLALVMSRRERETAKALIAASSHLIEANDISALSALSGTPHVVGPFINVYNEDTARYLRERGAQRIVLPAELPGAAIHCIAGAGEPDAEIEVQAFGPMALSLSSRCYHARAHGLGRDSCQFICDRDPDGLAVEDLEGNAFVRVNGIQTLASSTLELGPHLDALHGSGVTHFRLSPVHVDMVQVAEIYRRFLDGGADPSDLRTGLHEASVSGPLDTGFYGAGEAFA